MKAVFLDLNGVISEESKDFVKNWDEFHFIPESKEAIALLSKKFPVVIITNQSGIARGLFSQATLDDMNSRMLKEIEELGGKITGIYICPHGPDDGCTCRKPSIEMIERASKEHGLDPKKSYMIGDKSSDIKMGQNAGCKNILVLTGYGSDYNGPEPDFTVKDLMTAAKLILDQEAI